MPSFWNSLEKPCMALAPMADVTDPAFRAIIAETAAPDVMWTEFVSADGLYHTREKPTRTGERMKDEENPLVRDLRYADTERPIVAQFFTSKPEMMEYAARYAVASGFDGVDINMGCPVDTIQKQGAGACLIKEPELAKKVIAAAIRGTEGKIPVSIKTRIGWNRPEEYQEWLPHLLDEGISALTLHLRTKKEMSKVPAHYEFAGDIVSFCRSINPNIFLLANGDLESVADARAKAELYGFDGMMLGRAIFGNPWLFAGEAPEDHTPEERIAMLIRLACAFDAMRPRKHFAIMKKHFKAFISGFDGAGEFRARLMETSSLAELEAAVATYKP